VAASDTTVAITEGSGKPIATRTVDNQLRQKIVLSGAEDGESYVFLPAHDAADAGAPLKIGGKANRAAQSAVSANGDRVDGWFTREGQLGAIATPEAGIVYVADASGGRVATFSVYGSSALNNAVAQAVAAAGSGLRVYVTAASFVVSAYTGAGVVTLRDNTTEVYPLGGVTAVNLASAFHVAPPGHYLCRTTANTALNIHLSGNATIKWALAGYVAP